jgi:hypothetical protein
MTISTFVGMTCNMKFHKRNEENVTQCQFWRTRSKWNLKNEIGSINVNIMH